MTVTSLLAHVLDQLEWELLDPEEAAGAGHMLLNIMKQGPGALLEPERADAGRKEAIRECAPPEGGILPPCRQSEAAGVKEECSGIDAVRKELLDNYTALIADTARGEYHG